MSKDIGLRIKELREVKNLTQTEFSEQIGIKQANLSHIENKGEKISIDVISKIISNFNIDANWLLTGVGEIQKSDQERNIYKLKTDYNIENQSIPLYEVDATAGLITLFDNQIMQNPIGELSIPNAPKCDGAVYVRGDSMYPILKSGDIIAYKTIYDPANIFWGEMYLLDIDVEGEQYLTIKYVQRSDKGDDHVYLVSHNGNHQPVHILKSNIRALALVKASIRYNSMG